MRPRPQSGEDGAPILIQGETGTGKELLARGIHYNSGRHTSPLMIQNCGGMPDELLQSELFGHKRGAFTGAISDRLGLFRAADKGTVFLDEISEVSPSFQVSLLRFLQEGEVKPIGSDKTETCDVRVIVASNRPLKALAEAGKFRKDLYFRLRGFELEVPPLRERPDDTPALAEFFAAKHSNVIGRKVLGISAGVLEKLIHFDWPGNVRELENEIRRMVALAKDGEYLTTDALSPAILAAAPRAPRVKGFMPEGVTLKEKVEIWRSSSSAKCCRGIGGTRAGRRVSLVSRAWVLPTRSSATGSPKRTKAMSDPDDNDNKPEAAVLRFPQSRVRAPGSEEPLNIIGTSPLAGVLGAPSEQTTGHWCSHCRGIWYGFLLEVACPVCGNRHG